MNNFKFNKQLLIVLHLIIQEPRAKFGITVAWNSKTKNTNEHKLLINCTYAINFLLNTKNIPL